MKKILFVIHALEYGGAERSLVNLLNELPQDKYAVDLLLFQRKGDFLAQLPPWVHVLDTPGAISGLYAPVSGAGKYRLTKLVGTACARVVRRTRKSRSAWRWRHFYRRKIAMLPGHYDVAVAFPVQQRIAGRRRPNRRCFQRCAGRLDPYIYCHISLLVCLCHGVGLGAVRHSLRSVFVRQKCMETLCMAAGGNRGFGRCAADIYRLASG